MNKLKSTILRRTDNYFIKSIHFSILEKLNSFEKTKKNTFLNLIKKKKVATGYVPYIHDKTEINIYNFFSINYGIRSPFHTLLAFTDINFNPLVSIYKKLNSREILSISNKEIQSMDLDFAKIEFCIVLLMNDRMRIDHGGTIGGHLRFWVNYDNFSSYVHSLPIRNLTHHFCTKWIKNLSNKKFGSLQDRRLYPLAADHVYHYNFGQKHKIIKDRGDLSDKLIAPFGFSLIKQNNIFTAIYHNSTLNRESRFTKIKNLIIHSIAIPPKIKCDLEIFFGEACSNKSKFKVCLYKKNLDSSEVKLSDQKEICIDIKKPVILSELFNIEELNSNVYWLNIEPLSGLHDNYYLNVFYKSKNNKVFDNVHSHSFLPINKSISNGRGLKFAPFKYCINQGFYPVLAVWSGRFKSLSIRLRIFSAQNSKFEKVYNLNLPTKEIVYFELQNYIDKELAENNFNDLFVAQIESDEENLQASMFNIKLKDKEIKSISVDHLTGG